MLSGMDTDSALLRLHHAAGGAGWLRRLLDACTHAGDEAPIAALGADDAAWTAAGAPPPARAATSGEDARRAAEAALRWREGGAHRHLVGWGSALYPSQLAGAPQPPTLLFVEGRVERLWWPQIAVVGSRAPTPAGRERAARWARAFGEAGYVVTSGLAAGIDTAAHGACLEAPGSVAVMGTGPDQCYPAINSALKTALAREGCLVTEHPPGTPPLAAHFPARNRVIAGLALATVVIEAAQRSGALITARLAAEAGREVAALPGAPENPKARGCHRLIRDGALLADEPGQILDLLGEVAGRAVPALREHLGGSGRQMLDGDGPPQDPGAVGCPPADPRARHVLAALGSEGADLDELSLRTGLTGSTLAPILLAMELEGRLTQQHGVYHPCGSAPPTGAVPRRRRTG
jgi:DNA processing protein